MAKLTVNRFSDRDEAEAHYLVEVDRLAEAERGKYMTPGSGQAMTYEAKYREALAGGGPLLQAEADALDLPLQEVVAAVLAARQRWLKGEAGIEAERRKAKDRVRRAESARDMHAALESLRETLPG